MTVKQVLNLKDSVDSVEIFTDQHNTWVFKGPSNTINHCLSQEVLTPYLDRDVRNFVIQKSRLIIFCK